VVLGDDGEAGRIGRFRFRVEAVGLSVHRVHELIIGREAAVGADGVDGGEDGNGAVNMECQSAALLQVPENGRLEAYMKVPSRIKLIRE